MRLENEYVHYRASFVVTPTAGTPDSAFPYIAERLQQWVELKEEEHTAGGPERSVIARVLHSNAIDLSDTYDISMAGDDVGVTSVPCYVSEAFISGFSLPKEYEGGLSTRSDARMICTRAHIGRGDWHLPEAWALEYDEPDGGMAWRHWHTCVGIVRKGDEAAQLSRTAPCVVNVRISNYMKYGYVGETPEQPPATTPRFIRELLQLPGFEARVGNTRVRDDVTDITAESCERDFIANLLDPLRGLPLVVAVSDEEGVQPAGNLHVLANRLMGSANVYALDVRDEEATQAFYANFPPETSAYAFSSGAGVLRAYQPQPELFNTHDSVRHRFFTKDRLLEMAGQGKGVASMIARSMVESHALREGVVLTIDDVDDFERDEQVRRQLADLRERAEASGKRVNALLQASSADELEKERLRQEIEAYAQTFDEEVEGLENRVRELEGDLRDARRESAQLRRGPLQALADKGSASLDDYLTMVELLYPDRVAVLDEAHESALAWEYDASSAPELLRAVATTLWDLKFGGWRGDLEAEFRARTGFELALSEGKLTKANRRLMKSRQATYKGVAIDVAPHVKGKGRYNQTMRVYLGFYDEGGERLVVIASCGAHKETAGTHYM